MTIEQKRRKLFEAACTRLGFSNLSFKCLGETHGCDGCNDYADERASLYYEFFNAALDAVVIELPQQWNDDGCGAFYKSEDGPHMDSKEVRAAIEQAGLGLKVMP